MKRQLAFTLSEVIVTVLIIAMIAAITLPIMVGAKQRAKQAPCASQLRQLYFAFQLYCDDAGSLVQTPPTIASIKEFAGDVRLFSCPVESWVTEVRPGEFPTTLFVPAHMYKVLPTSTFRISYGYVRDYSPADEAGEWERIRATGGSIGLFACIWHGRLVRTVNVDGFFPHLDGPILRVCLDGHAYVLRARDKPDTPPNIDDIFYKPYNRAPDSRY